LSCEIFKFFLNLFFFLEDAPPPELLQKIKEYSVKFVFPGTTKLAPPVLGLHGFF